MRVRVTIRRLMLAVVAAGLVMAHARGTDDPWLALALDLIMALFLYGTLQARFGPERARDWWFGFAALGWSHLFLTLLANDYVPTIWVLKATQESVFNQFRMSRYVLDVDPMFPSGPQRGPRSFSDVLAGMYEVFGILLSLPVGVAGGWVSAMLGRREQRKSEV